MFRTGNRGVVFSIFFAAPLLFTLAGVAAAAPLKTAVFVAIDGTLSSGVSGYSSAQINSHERVFRRLPTDGSVAVGILQYTRTIDITLPLTNISSPDERSALLSALRSMQWEIGTVDKNISGAIEAAQMGLVDMVDCSKINCLINVSALGYQTMSGNPGAAAGDAVSAGIDQVNCIGYGDADLYCGFIAGERSFSVFGNSPAAYRQSLNEMFVAEELIPPSIPAPSAIALLLSAMAGLFAFRRAGRDDGADCTSLPGNQAGSHG